MSTDSTGSADRTLRDLLRTDGRLSFERATRILADVADVLAPMHAAGQAHGAITPQSAHIDAAGRATLGHPVADTTSTGLLPPAYLAPERIAGESAGPRSDVYSLGLVGWEMLTGETPWAGDSLAEILINQQEHDLARLTTVRPGVPRPLLLAIEGALHKSPSDRWATAGEMLAALGAPSAAAAPPVEARAVVLGPISAHREPVVPVRPVSSPRRTRSGKKFAMVALALAVIVAGGAALASFQGREKQRVTGPWLDSLTTSTSGGVVITDDTMNTAARLRAQAQRESLAAAVPAYPASAYPAPADPAPAYPPPSYASPATPAATPAATPVSPTPPTVDTRAADDQAAQEAALARARAESARQQAAADSARRAAVPVESSPATPTQPTPAAPTRDSTPARPATSDSTRRPATKPDSTRPDTSGVAVR